MKKERYIIGGAISNCVHVAGIFEYLKIAEQFGYISQFLGAAVSLQVFVEAIEIFNPEIVCISYRLSPIALRGILKDFFDILVTKRLIEKRSYYFGGTPGCIEIAKEFKYFSNFFQGEENLLYIYKTLSLDGQPQVESGHIYQLKDSNFNPKSWHNNNYLPMLRHHFGLPSLFETIAGVTKIAESEQVDIISLAPDQNAQEYFFEPDKIDKALDGSGGIPIRSENDLYDIWKATQTGNYLRLKIYAGTNHLLEWAEMSVRIIKNAWGTIPLFWYSVLDGRSKRPLQDAIKENMKVINWYARQDIPVEINDSHQWSLRECSDTIFIVDLYLAAYNAKRLGVKTFIAQFMFNTPRLTSGKMDLAKMLAAIELLNELEDESFIYLKQIRAGLTHFSIDMDVAKGQLAASTLLGLALKPQIIHVVSYSEADHAAKPEDVIESCKIVKGILRNSWQGFPDLTQDSEIEERKDYLVTEAKVVLKQIKDFLGSYSPDPLADPLCLTKMVQAGFLDAPHLKGNPAALGEIRTRPINGGYDSIDYAGFKLKESERIFHILDSSKSKELST
jgi:hypothetical protein